MRTGGGGGFPCVGTGGCRDHARDRGAAQCKDVVAAGGEPQSAQGDLQDGVRRAVAHQAVGLHRGDLVRSSRGHDPQVPESRAAEVLHQRLHAGVVHDETKGTFRSGVEVSIPGGFTGDVIGGGEDRPGGGVR